MDLLALLCVGVVLVFVIPALAFFKALDTSKGLKRLEARIAALETSVQRLESAPAPVRDTASTQESQPPSAVDEVLKPWTKPWSPPVETIPAPEATAPLTAGGEATGRVEPVGPAPPPPPPATDPALPGAPRWGQSARPHAAPATERIARPQTVRASDDETLENRIGSRWLLYIGMLAVLVGVAYFLRYAIENDWITPGMRVGLGALVGILFVAGGLRAVRAGYDLYGQILSGGGIGILYLCSFAATNLYALIDRGPAFGLMVLITAGSAWLADREKSAALALAATIGGFLTPFLVGGSSPTEVPLFSYDLLLVTGTMLLARRRNWPWLNMTSFVFTGLTVVTWMLTSYRGTRYLTTELFLTAFCAMFVAIWWDSRRRTSPWDAFITGTLWISPFFYHLLSLTILWSHQTAFLIYLIAGTSVALVMLARMMLPGPSKDTLQFLVWSATLLPLSAWISSHSSAVPLPALMGTVAALYLLHLLVLLGNLTNSPLAGARMVLLHLNAFGFLWLGYVVLEPQHLAWTGPFAFGIAGWHLALSWLFRRGDDLQPHLVAISFAALAVGVALQFDGPAVVIGWAAEGAVLTWIGLKARPWVRLAGGVLLAIGIGRLLQLLTSPVPVWYTPVLNPRTLAGLFVVALLWLSAWLHRRHDALKHAVEGGVLLVAAHLVLLAVFIGEIQAFLGVEMAPQRDALFVMGTSMVGLRIVVLGLQQRQLWMRLVGSLVMVTSVSGLLLLVFGPPTDWQPAFLNMRALSAAFVIASIAYAGHVHRRTDPRLFVLEAGSARVAANLLAIAAISAEITTFWAFDADGRSAHLAREMTMSIAWGSYAVGMIVFGISRRDALVRQTAIGVLAVTIGKVFFVDLAELDRLYRILSVIGLGALLLVTSFLYQRFAGRLSNSESEAQ